MQENDIYKEKITTNVVMSYYRMVVMILILLCELEPY